LKLFSGIKKIFGLGLNNEKSWNPSLWNLRGSQSIAGETVTEETALTYSAVWNAVVLISGTIASLPLHLRRPDGPDGRSNKLALENPLYQVMHARYNPYMSAMAGRECLMSHILTWGNGYAEIVRNGYGGVKELWPITPNRVKPLMHEGGLVYEIRMSDGDDVYLPYEKVLHVPGMGFDGFTGYSIIAMARKSIGLGMALETFGSLYFGQGTHPSVVIKHPHQLNATAHDNLKRSLSDTYSGLGQSHRLMLLEDGMEMEKVGIPPDDSQFLESRTFQVPEIARWFNLPPHKLKDLTKSSFNNIEAEQTSFVTDSILPWLIRCEQAYDMQLLAPLAQSQKLYFKHIVEGLLRANAKDRAEFYTAMLNNGVMSINEVREKEDMNPVEGGDIHLVPLNMTSLENAGKPQQVLVEEVPVEEAETNEPDEGEPADTSLRLIQALASPGRHLTGGGSQNENSES